MQPYLHTVQYYETDQMHITHHSNYIRWMEEARVAFLDGLGWGYDRLEAMGLISPVTAVHANYYRPSRFHEVIAITVRLKSYKGVRLVLDYEMRNHETDVLVCSGTSEHCFLDGNGRVLRLTRACPELDAALQALLP